MADSIKIKIDTSRYVTPSQDDVASAKRYVLQREEHADMLAGRIDDILSDAAERVVLICYKYSVDPKNLVFSSAFNGDMMDEISNVMDEAEDEIYDLILEYSTRAAKDRDSANMLAAWIAALGRGDRNMRDTLHTYLYKTMKDWEAAIAAMRYVGMSQPDAVTRIKTYLHDIYNMPEVLTAFRRRNEFAATYIYYGGVQRGAVGISNNGATNVVNMGRITLQMAWMRAQGMSFEKDGATGYWQARGSNFPCDLCDSETGFHPDIREIYTKSYPHPHCMCYRIPIFVRDNNIQR